MTPERAVSISMPFTFLHKAPQRLQALVQALQSIDRNSIPGDIVECGVWAGGNIILARLLSPDRKCWLYDTFDGMPEPGEFDVTWHGRHGQKGTVAMPLCAVIDNLTATGTMHFELCRFVIGPVETTLKQRANRPVQIALLRLDTDWYSSTLAELQHLWPLVSPGGFLMVDDYGHWRGCRRAVDEYFAGSIPQRTMVDYSCLMLVKPGDRTVPAPI